MRILQSATKKSAFALGETMIVLPSHDPESVARLSAKRIYP
jgi:hypothetical protein